MTKDKPDLISLTRNSLPDVDIDSKIFHRVKHHQCHVQQRTMATNKDPYLIFTLDGGGDRECGSVSVAENGIITQLCSVPSAYSIGGIYQVTI